jgi:hypothetical protein
MVMSKEIKDRLADALISAFTLAAAISWRETLIKIVEFYLPGDVPQLWANVAITMIITLIVIGIIYFVLIADRAAENTFDTFQVDDEENEKREEK